MKRPRLTRKGGWRLVVYSADCDLFGDCPICRTDYAECPCPGPTVDGMDYREFDGVLYARPIVPPDFDQWRPVMRGAYLKGAHAAHAGASRGSVPYREIRHDDGRLFWSSALARAWRAGFDDATKWINGGN